MLCGCSCQLQYSFHKPGPAVAYVKQAPNQEKSRIKSEFLQVALKQSRNQHVCSGNCNKHRVS